MRIALLGYGKMGKAIEAIALREGDDVVVRLNSSNQATFDYGQLKNCDVAIEFSRPDRAVHNILRCFEAKVPVVVGTTGWLDRLPEVEAACIRSEGALLWASNFSIGVQLFFALNKKLALLMSRHAAYSDVRIEEIHHVHKLDAPSGTALSLAGQLLSASENLKSWKAFPVGSQLPSDSSILPVFYDRTDDVPGTHKVCYASAQDKIEIVHTAFNRDGFASGALAAAHWLVGRKGVFTMDDFLQL
ncbi:MAG: 4-hydroxy-tetrahydrodipicolinate reductase [Bacteroidota bacterium]